jgi:hypothetical protein
MNAPKFRIKLDVPHSFAVEPGFYKANHCHDFKLLEDALNGVWWEPNTGLMMLRPSFLGELWYDSTNWVPLTSWLYDSAYWQTVAPISNPDTGTVLSTFMATVLSSGAGGDIPSLASITGLATVTLASTLTSDAIVWVMQSTTALVADEGFVWHYHALGHKHHRLKNWFVLQWDNMAFHFSFDGVCRVYLYGSDHSVAPTLLEQFEICSPGDIMEKDGYFIFIPIPGYGISLIHSLSPQTLDNRTSSARSGSGRGHLVKLPTRGTSPNQYIHNGGNITLGVAARLTTVGHLFGCHRIRYNTTSSGVFNDAPFDPGFKPSTSPTTQPILVDWAASNAYTTTAAVVRKADDSANWAAGTDRLGRVKLTMATSDAHYTPFVLGTFVYWSPVFNTRDTTAFDAGTLQYLEFTEDELAHFEGHCVILHKTDAARKVCERGDTTFLLERADPDGAGGYSSYVTQCGGMARLESADIHMDPGGMYYIAHWELKDLNGLFSEVHQTAQSAFDRLSVGVAINQVLAAAGMTSISSLPADSTSLILPPVPQGQSWRLGSSPGDDGQEIIKQLLLFLRRENVEYRIRYDWDASAWYLETKPRNTAVVWTLTPFPDEADYTTKRLLIADGSDKVGELRVNPPEANIIQAIGLTSSEVSSERMSTQPIVNHPSLVDKTSLDYLGRVKVAYPVFAPISDANELAKMARRVYDAACHRELMLKIPAKDFYPAFVPSSYVTVRGLSATGIRADVYTQLWLKRRHVKMAYQQSGDYVCDVVYEVSTTWESPIS